MVAPTTPSAIDDQATIGAPTRYTPILVGRDCATDADANAKTGVEYWTLTVPEDRANPEPTIDLHGYRISAATDPDSAPTVIDLGPTTSLTLPSNDPDIAAQLLEALQRCRGRLVTGGFSLSSYNFEAEISDVTDYTIAAGIGESFITALSQDAPAALVAADRFPGTFRGVFLQNPVDPGSSWQADPAKDLAAAFDRYGALCTADPDCGSSYPDLPGGWRASYEAPELSPRLIENVPYSGQHARIFLIGTNRTLSVLVDGAVPHNPARSR